MCSYRNREQVLTPKEVEDYMAFIDPNHDLANMKADISWAEHNGRIDIRHLYTNKTKG